MQPTDWLLGEIDDLTDEIVNISPSEWAEANRYLPASVTPRPGYYDYSVTPYLREIVDCFDRRSPIREVAIMKGAQTGGTVGVLENWIGYVIAHVKTAPMMFVTATKELAALRMDEYIMPMIEQSGLLPLLQNNSSNKRKSGDTDRKKSWRGGGWLVPNSANEAAGMRSASIPCLALDEVDSMPVRVGKDGDPGALLRRRTAAFSKSYKVCSISTPTTTEESRIARDYKDGDQSIFKVPCLGCDKYEELKWRWDDKEGKQIGGIVWTTDEHRHVVPGSVMYACKHCGHCHTNEHKRIMLPRGYWHPTAVPIHPSFRSFHISGLMSPADFFPYERAVVDWLKAWDPVANKAIDFELLQEFYNNVLGKTYRLSGSKLTFTNVARHAREYKSGEIPNEMAQRMCGSKIGFLTCTADVQKNFIAASVMAWGPNRVGFHVHRYRFDGDTGDPNDPDGPWGELAKLIDTRFPDGAGREYFIKTTLVDSGYRTSEVYTFCSKYEYGVYPLKGDDAVKAGPLKEFKRLKEASKMGVDGWLVNVNHYKHRISAVLRASPNTDTEMAMVDSVSFPCDLENDALEELCGEEFVKNKSGRWEWRRLRARNELWDLAVYNAAARDITAFMVCREHFELDFVNWSEFWPYAESNRFGWAEVAPVAGD